MSFREGLGFGVGIAVDMLAVEVLTVDVLAVGLLAIDVVVDLTGYTQRFELEQYPRVMSQHSVPQVCWFDLHFFIIAY